MLHVHPEFHIFFDSYIFCFIHVCVFLLFFGLCRITGQLGVLGGGGTSAPTKIVLTLDDLVFINTQLSKRVNNNNK